ncbi:hypothetical protein H0H81_011594 [Sphagnurus paluster]|uniref:non-specific serine/threonine protein kinase n=1 Tax=Sphagnurus paluster TaxID=117069 RepID=A0A9P7GRC8_9AGAR|nr:hypothetical protein H0H81_011594 [Sphagnurus paluster]
MLGARTKQIYAYGKRSQRIVNISDERDRKAIPNIFDDIDPVPRAPIASKMKKREHTVHTKSKTPSPKILHIHRKKRLSPVLSPTKKRTRVAQIIDTELSRKELSSPKPKALTSGKNDTASSRIPLADFSLNVPGSPVVSAKVRRTKAPGTKAPALKSNKQFSPFVDVDIIILDDAGNTLRQEKRVSRTDVKSNPIKDEIVRPSKPRPTRSKKSVPVDENVDDEVVELSTRPKRPTRRAVLTVYSDESDSELENDYLNRNSNVPTNTTLFSSVAGPSRTRRMVEVVIPPAPYATKKKPQPVSPQPLTPPPLSDPIPRVPPARYQPIPSPIARPRQLTPIRHRGGRNPFDPPTPPSPFTDADISLDFELSIEESLHLSASSAPLPDIPNYLQPLLAQCGQGAYGPIEFSSFIETFPFDPVVDSGVGKSIDLRFRKVGEASYSEVFGIGDVVLKVIPLRDETVGNANEGGDEEDGPAPSDAKDVLKEVIVTQAMGEVCDGFVKLLKAYIVRGKYPEVLLRLWDEYHANKGSESVRPDKFLVSQIYAIIVLPNGGPDLEAYKFVNTNKMGWRQACSIFWQVAKSLAHAERLVSFEHRDLHWGQILVKDLPIPEVFPLRMRNQNARSSPKSSRVYMDDPVHGVHATLIDLGLSRMDAGDGDGGEIVHWTPFEEEVFMGEGDYQFDIYRMMRELISDTWEDFKPVTNVMLTHTHQWLHYLVMKLLHSKRLKVPLTLRGPPKPDAYAFTEKHCYDCLVDIERWLGSCVAAFSPAPKPKGKGRKKVQALPPPNSTLISPACAGEIVEYAVKKGWIQPTSM